MDWAVSSRVLPLQALATLSYVFLSLTLLWSRPERQENETTSTKHNGIMHSGRLFLHGGNWFAGGTIVSGLWRFLGGQQRGKCAGDSYNRMWLNCDIPSARREGGIGVQLVDLLTGVQRGGQDRSWIAPGPILRAWANTNMYLNVLDTRMVAFSWCGLEKPQIWVSESSGGQVTRHLISFVEGTTVSKGTSRLQHTQKPGWRLMIQSQFLFSSEMGCRGPSQPTT